MNQLKELLRIRDYRYLWSAQAGTDFGDSLTMLSLMILVQNLTGSTVAVAGLMISLTLPTLIFSMVSGVYVDRLDRRKMMIVSDSVRAVMVLGFLFVRSAEMIPLIYLVAFTQAGIGTLFNPARAAMLPRIVGKQKLLAANSISQTTRTLFGVGGTAAAGVLAGVFQTQAPAFIVNSALFVVSALLISRIHTDGRPEEEADPRGAWADMKSGFSMIVSTRPLRGILTAAGVTMLGLGAVNVLMVPLVIGELQISEVFFGLIEAGQVLGVVVAGGLVAGLAARLKAPSLVSVGLIGLGLAVMLLYFPTRVWQLTLTLFVIGFAIVPTNAGVATLSQTLIPDSMRGRVSGALNASISGATIISMGLAGVTAAAIGVRNVFLVSGGLAILAGLLARFMLRGEEVVSGAVSEPVVDTVG